MVSMTCSARKAHEYKGVSVCFGLKANTYNMLCDAFFLKLHLQDLDVDVEI